VRPGFVSNAKGKAIALSQVWAGEAFSLFRLTLDGGFPLTRAFIERDDAERAPGTSTKNRTSKSARPSRRYLE
jgi:hypothetical protein